MEAEQKWRFQFEFTIFHARSLDKAQGCFPGLRKESSEVLMGQDNVAENTGLARVIVAILLLTSFLPPMCHSQTTALDSLMRQLKHTDPQVRMAAIWALRDKHDARAVEPLIAVLKNDKDTRTRCSASIALGFLKDRRAVEPLILALRDKRIREAASDGLSMIGDVRAVEPLIALLKDSGFYGEDFLSRMGTIAVEPLIASLQDKSIRLPAMRILGRIRDARAVEPLLAMMKNKDPDVRMTAAEALGETKDVRAVEPLIALLKDGATGVRWQSARALAKIGDRRAVPPLIAALNGRYEDLRWEATYALSQIKDTLAVEPLIALLKDPNRDIRKSAITVLGSIRDPRAVPPFIALLKDRDPDIRATIVDNILRNDRRSVEALIRCLEDKAMDVRWRAAWSLRDSRDTIASRALTRVLEGRRVEEIVKSYSSFIRKGEAGTELFLIVALRESGTSEMATDFINSGNSHLEKAGRRWADLKGYTTINRYYEVRTPPWGRNR